MAQYLALELVKQHLNIDAEYTGDDTYIQHLSDAVEGAVANRIKQPLKNLENESGQLPTPLVQAMLFLVGDWYQSRESVAFGASPVEVPRTFEYLCDQYTCYHQEGGAE